ncbi:MAG: bacillithiol system redox-active protein YtxJ [Trueperaceae bacterium]|nr:bacillithiol system redox-active protein YtxJ [Trueperaceae bacterium]
MQSLKSPEDVSAMLEHSRKEAVFLYKHSASCPVSFFARQEVEAAAENHPVYMVIVQQAREISNELAQNLAVKHETPQLILLKEARAQGVISHGNIKLEAFDTLLQEV